MIIYHPISLYYKKNYQYNASGYTILLVLPFGGRMFRFSGEPTLEQLTYNWPWEKHGELRSRPAIFNVWPWDLLIVMAKLNLTGNWSLLNLKVNFSVTIGILGINTWSFLYLPSKIMASITCCRKFLTNNRVPLQSFGGSRFLRSIIGTPGLRWRCGEEVQVDQWHRQWTVITCGNNEYAGGQPSGSLWLWIASL